MLVAPNRPVQAAEAGRAPNELLAGVLGRLAALAPFPFRCAQSFAAFVIFATGSRVALVPDHMTLLFVRIGGDPMTDGAELAAHA